MQQEQQDEAEDQENEQRGRGVVGENSENVKQKCENFALVVAAFVQA